MNKAKKSIGILLIVILLAGCIVLDALEVRYETVATRWWSGTFGTVETENGDTQLKAMDAAAELTELIAEEGIVLLKNNGTLPMAPSKDNRMVALLGYASYSPMYIGAGSVSQSGSYLSNDFIDFYDAFETAGFSVNKDMKEYYAKYGNSNGATGDMSGSGWSQATGVDDGPLYGDGEASKALLSALDKAKAEAKTAVLVFSRVGAEGGDCALEMDGAANGDAGKHYLQFQQTEIDLIEYAENNFENVIVVINSSNAMELGELDNDLVDAVLWIGGPGSTGIQALADIVAGDVNPSGRLPDTYAYDLKTAPSYWSATSGTYANYEEFGESTYTYNGVTYTFNNEVDGGVTYDVEGIYVGYRFYETADEEGYLKFEDAVQYPFGFGLSYTTFDWEVVSSSFGNTHGDIKIEVKVTNKGDKAGKDVVELYYTAPYYKDRGIEKSSKVLGAFAKTKNLKPGESDTVTLTMPVDNISSYDYKGEKCYVADEGTYTFNLQTDSHNVKVNSDGKAMSALEYKVSDRRIYKDSGVGARSTDLVPAENAFDYSSVGDGNIGSTIPYVSRTDFAGTHPSVTMGKRLDQYDDLKMGADAIKYITQESLGGSDVKLENDAKYVTKSLVAVATNEKNGLTVDDVAGYTEWDDEIWDKLINQMSVDELAIIAEDCGYGTPEIESMAINGLASSLLQMEILRCFMTEHDVLIHTPEISSSQQLMLETGLQKIDDRLWAALEYNYDLVSLVDIRVFDGGVLESLRIYLDKKKPGGTYSDVYRDSKGRDFFDVTGCIPFLRETRTETLPDKVSLDPAYLEDLSRLEEEYETFAELGVPIFVSFACIDIDQVPEEEQGNLELMGELFLEKFSQMDCVKVFGRIDDFIYHDEDCFDTVYHLLSIPAQQCTGIWIRDLTPLLIEAGLLDGG